MVTVLASEFEAWLGILRCVLGKDTLFSQCLSPPRWVRTGQLNSRGNIAMD